MARIRTIKPEFFHDEKLADLPVLARLVYIGLWCYADREGRLEDRPRYLASQILPYDAKAFGPAFQALLEGGWVHPYAVNGSNYLYLPKFTKHQRPHHTEAESVYPAPSPCSNGEITVNSPLEHGEAPDGREGKGKEGKGVQEGKGEGKGDARPRLANPSPDDLVEVWNEFVPPLHPLKGLSPTRKQHARARLAEHPELDYWREVLRLVVASAFCMGQNDRAWKANFDWLLRPDSGAKVLEGRYANKPAPVTWVPGMELRS